MSGSCVISIKSPSGDKSHPASSIFKYGSLSPQLSFLVSRIDLIEREISGLIANFA